MLTFSTVTLLFNGLTLALALGLLLIILWHDSSKELNQFFAIFLFFVLLWNSGSLLTQVSLLTFNDASFLSITVAVLELGFLGASVAVYALATVMLGMQSRRFRMLVLAALGFIVLRVLLIVTQTTTLVADSENILSYRFQPLYTAFYLGFDTVTLFLIWQYRRKFRSRGLLVGIVLFLMGQGVTFVNPSLTMASFSTSLSSVGALIISFSFVQMEIIIPLSERISQVESMHRVSFAITSQIALNTVLNEIASQAANWLGADAAAMLLKGHRDGAFLRLVAVHNLPEKLLDTCVENGFGVAGTVAQRGHSIHLENYERDWIGSDDFGIARATFGSVICVPLNYGDEILGVLMVIAGRQGRLFEVNDVRLLELLAAQAAVAIAHSQSFREQKQLTEQVEAARAQLEAVLESTDNPVIAVDRAARVIFANPAARVFIPVDDDKSLYELLPRHVFPNNLRDVVRAIRKGKEFTYEIELDDKVYVCHVARLGGHRTAGWVAVLNDITELKELDRLKSEMVRMASHDLKNPLMGATTHLELLRDELQGIDAPEVYEDIQTIEFQLERMHRIVSGILDIEKLRSVSSNMDICEPESIIRDVVAELGHFISDKNIEVEVSTEEEIGSFIGDRDNFQRALVNVVENAIKFTEAYGRVGITIRREGDEIIFVVKDNGVGIPLELQTRVFDRFFRGQQKGVEHVTGSGLGLSFVKTVVENHDGRIWLESQNGMGTTFYIAVPSVAS